ncbi:MAG: hypothetical protein HQM12_21055, partial [SAR324 cluster bacterium]|nr:hypothetical protein [SAR324 cluster bacterium]
EWGKVMKVEILNFLDSDKEHYPGHTHRTDVPSFSNASAGEPYPEHVRKRIRIHFVREYPLRIGDKLANRHGNKGVVTRIEPDKEMPSLDNKKVEIILNPFGVLGRQNLGQLLELHLSDRKQPRTLEDWEKFTWDEQHLLKSPVRQAGWMYILRLKHHAVDKLNGRGEFTDFSEDSALTGQPVKGRNHQGGQRLGEMEWWALHAHHTPKLLKSLYETLGDTETQTMNGIRFLLRMLGIDFKVDSTTKKVKWSVWEIPAYTTVKPLSEFVWNDYLKKPQQLSESGNDNLTQPMSEFVRNDDLKNPQQLSESGNDNLKQPKQWALELPCQVAHPLTMPRIIQIMKNNPDFRTWLKKQSMTPEWIDGLNDEDWKKWMYPYVKKEMEESGEKTDTEEKIKQNLRLSQLILPPPSYLKDENRFAELLKDLIEDLQRYAAAIHKAEKDITPVPGQNDQENEESLKKRAHWHQLQIKFGRRLLLFFDRKYQSTLSLRKSPTTSLMELLQGKDGLLRHHWGGKRLRYSGRAVIVGDPTLPIDQVLLPEEIVVELFPSSLTGHEYTLWKREWDNPTSDIRQTWREATKKNIESIGDKRPVLLNRNPSLHQLSILAFRWKLTSPDDATIHLSPLVCEGFGADFDGDNIVVFLPPENVTDECRQLFPQNLLRHPRSGEFSLSSGKDLSLAAFIMNNPLKTKYLEWQTRLKQHVDQKIIYLEINTFFEEAWKELHSYQNGNYLSLTLRSLYDVVNSLKTSLRETNAEDKLKEWANANNNHVISLFIRSGAQKASVFYPGCICRGLVQLPDETTRELKSSVLEGFSVVEYTQLAMESRSNLLTKYLGTAGFGYLSRKMAEVAYDLVITEEDCGDQKGIPLLSSWLTEGRKSLGSGKWRSPISCQSKEGICRQCYGNDPVTGQPIALGTPVGIRAAQVLGERGTQLAMKQFKQETYASVGRIEELQAIFHPDCVKKAPESVILHELMAAKQADDTLFSTAIDQIQDQELKKEVLSILELLTNDNIDKNENLLDSKTGWIPIRVALKGLNTLYYPQGVLSIHIETLLCALRKENGELYSVKEKMTHQGWLRQLLFEGQSRVLEELWLHLLVHPKPIEESLDLKSAMLTHS